MFQSSVPEEKPRIMHGVMNPLNIIKAVECGIDILDSSYVFVVTERHSALIFSFDQADKSVDSPINGGGDGPKRGFELNFTDERSEKSAEYQINRKLPSKT